MGFRIRERHLARQQNLERLRRQAYEREVALLNPKGVQDANFELAELLEKLKKVKQDLPEPESAQSLMQNFEKQLINHHNGLIHKRLIASVAQNLL